MTTPDANWPNGRSDMAARIRGHDWTATPLGPIGGWPHHLKVVVDLMVGAPQAMMLAFGPGLTLLYNDAYASCLGDRHPAALGRSLPDVWPDVWPQIEPMTRRVFAGEHVEFADMPLASTRNGYVEETWWTFSLSPVWDDAHAVSAMLNVTVETTAKVLDRQERDRVQARLRDSEARNRLLIGGWAQAEWETDADGVVVADSPSWRAYTGQTREEWLGYGWLDAIHPDDRAYAERQWRESVAACGPVDAEFRLRAPDGGWRWTNVRAAPVPDAAGHIAKWAGLNIDIDARKRAEFALRESEARLAAAFEAVPAGIALIDRDGRRIIGNLAYRDLLQSDVIPSRDPDTARHWQAWDGDGRPIGTNDYPGARALRGDHVVPGQEMLCTRDDGTAIWTDVATVPTFDAAGQVNGCISVISDITERKRADAVLRAADERRRTDLERQVRDRTAERQASHDLLQAVMDASTDMIQVFDAVRDATGEIVDFVWVLNNHAAQSLYGEVRGESLLRHNPGVVPEGIFDAFRRVVETGIPDHGERHYAHEQFDGWFYQSVVRLGDGVATTTKDITAWKAAQADVLRLQEDVAQGRLRESEERFRLLVESVGDYAIFTTDREGFITSWPAGAASVFGWSERDILGRSADLTYVPEDVASGRPQQERDTAMREGLAPNVRWHLRHDGSRIFIDGSTQPLTGMDDTVREFIKIGQDVTEARRVQQALAESEDRLRTLAEGMPQLVWRSADRGYWTWSSPQWQTFTGLGAQASTGRGWLDAVHPDDLAAVMTAWGDAAVTDAIDVEYRVRHAADGEYVWHHTRALPVRSGDGRIVEWLGTTTDVQQLKELQERQTMLVAELQHRTRNLMGVVRSMADKTARASADLSDFRGRFRDRLDALARVQGLLSRLNDHDRVTFDELIRAELGAMDGNVDRISLDGPTGIRLRSSTVQILAMALHELATNALKYGALGQPAARLAITWSLAPAGGNGQPWLHIDWRESGVAMPACPSPHGTGQGRELIERALPYQLGARTSYTLGGDGVHCTIVAPVSISNTETDHG